jgi:hypothetical protein
MQVAIAAAVAVPATSLSHLFINPQSGHRLKPSGHSSFQSKTLPQVLQATWILVMWMNERFHNHAILPRSWDRPPPSAGPAMI